MWQGLQPTTNVVGGHPELDQMRSEAAEMEKRGTLLPTAAAQTQDAHTRKLLGDLAAAEAGIIDTQQI